MRFVMDVLIVFLLSLNCLVDYSQSVRPPNVHEKNQADEFEGMRTVVF